MERFAVDLHQLAKDLDAACARNIEACARKDARILALEQENALLLKMLEEARVTCHAKQEPKD